MLLTYDPAPYRSRSPERRVGLAAAHVLRAILSTDKVEIDVIGTSWPDGGPVILVMVDGQDVGAMMIEGGFACPWPPARHPWPFCLTR